MLNNNRIGYKWIILGIATGGQAAIAFGGLSLPPLAGYLTREFALTKMEFGAIISVLFFGASLASFPSGRFTDTLGVKIYLSISLIAMGLFVGLVCLAKSYINLLILGFLIGLGYGTMNPPTNRAVMEWFSKLNRGMAMSIKQTSVPIGGFLAAIIMSQLAMRFGWRYAFLIGGLMIFFSAILPWLYYKNPPIKLEENAWPALSPESVVSFKTLLKKKGLILLSIIACIFAMVQIATGTYLVLYLEETCLFSAAIAAGYLGLANVAGIIGRIFWGVVSDRLFGGRRRIVLQVIACICGFSAMLISMNVYSSVGKWFLALLIFMMGFTAIGWNGVYHAHLVEIAGKKLSGTATGLSLSIVFLGNLSGPIIFGGIVDLSGSYQHAWEFIVISMLFLMLLLFMLKEAAINEKGKGV